MRKYLPQVSLLLTMIFTLPISKSPAQPITEHWQFSIAHEEHLSDIGANSEAITKQNRQIYKASRNTIYSWGRINTALHFDDPFKSGSSNSFLDAEGIGAYAGVRAFNTLHYDLNFKDLNFWLYNAFISSYFIVENNNYIGISYDFSVGDFKFTPTLGYNYTISVKSPINGSEKFGTYVPEGTNDISSAIMTLSGSGPLNIIPSYPIMLSLQYEAKFGRDAFYNAVSNNPNNKNYGHYLRFCMSFPIYKQWSLSTAYISKYNVTGYGSDGDGNIAEIAINYSW